MATTATLRARVIALEERAQPPRLGLMLTQWVVEAEEFATDDVIAIEAGPAYARLRFDRKPGESLEGLEARANPRGCWRAQPMPLFVGEFRPYEERVEAIAAALHCKYGGHA